MHVPSGKPLSQQALPRAAVFAWEALSFFAVDPARQRESIGPADEWFVDDDPHRPHANFLMAMACVYCEYWRVLGDLARDVEPSLEELKVRLEGLLWPRGWTGWNADTLADESTWGEIRRLARACLDALGVHENLPRLPIDFEALIELDPVEWCKRERAIERASRGKKRGT